MKVFGLAGWSGSGKTTLVEKLIADLVDRGLRVASLKHAHHAFDIDRPGKDSHRHRMAGATEVLVASSARWALLHELRGAPEPTLDELVGRFGPADLVLVEGFKAAAIDKLEVHDPALGLPPLAGDDSCVVAVASAGPPPQGLRVPVLSRDDRAGIARLVLTRTGLG